MTHLYRRVMDAAAAVQDLIPRPPLAAMILGTGQGGVTELVDVQHRLPYTEIPGFPPPTVETHAGELLFGSLAGKDVLVFSGRFHHYEGLDLETVTLPVRLAKALDARILLMQGIGGGLNPQYREGDLVLIEDHINLMGVNPLIGPNDERMGPRFPDMIEPYDADLLERMERIAMEERIRAHRGVYVAVPGPNLETRAEYRMLRTIGADIVGMSTVPETLAAVHAGLRVACILAVSDMCLPDALQPADVPKIIAIGAKTEPKIAKIVERIIRDLPSSPAS
ncbi:MAG: purine-nucleoside phosphorylase [Planctomycetota bacterium]|jgi:purine-nucleoside phosphorylase